MTDRGSCSSGPTRRSICRRKHTAPRRRCRSQARSFVPSFARVCLQIFSVSVLASRVSRGFGNQCLEELFDEVFHAVPLRVHVVARGVGVALVAGDLLHQVAFYEAVVRVEQGATEETDLGGTPACLPHELLEVALRFLHVVVGSEAHREEGRRETFESVAVLLDEVPDVTLVFAHVDGGTDDHRIVAVRVRGSGGLDIHCVGLVAVAPDHVGDVLRDSGRQPLGGPVGDQNPYHDRSTSFWMALSSCAQQSASLTQATRFWSGCRVRCPPLTKATAPTTTHSTAPNTRRKVNKGNPGARDAKITRLPVALPCMSIAKSRLSVRS